MPTEVGTATLYDGSAGGTSFSLARTVTAGSAALTLQLSYFNGSGAVAPPTLSWNTTETMTIAIASSNPGGDYRSTIYFLSNPTAGALSLTGTFSNNANWRAALREWTDVSGTHGGVATNGDSTSGSATVTSVVSGEITIDAITNGGGSAATPGGSQSTSGLYSGVLSGGNYGVASTDTTSTGDVVMSWSISGGSIWVIAAAALVASGTPVIPVLNRVVSTPLRW